METLQFKKIRSVLLIGTMLLSSLVFQSCAEKMAFVNSNIVPAAEGMVKIKKDANDNYSIDMTLLRLAEPSRLNPPKKIYVVWMNTEQNGTKKLGLINTSSGIFSSTLKSSLKTVTSFKPIGFYITAEDDNNIQISEGQIIMKTFSSN